MDNSPKPMPRDEKPPTLTVAGKTIPPAASEWQREHERMVRFRRRQMWALTPDERLAHAASLRDQAFAEMAQNPDAVAAFHARQRRKRRLSVVDRLEEQLNGKRDTT